VYAIIDEENNPVINPGNLASRLKYRAKADTDETIAAREKIHLTSTEWEIIKTTINGGGGIPPKFG
jgi:hypothetical protein